MRIFAVGRNYVAHIDELKNERPDAPIIFLKPDTALLQHNRPFYYPPFSQDIHHEVELVLRLCKEGKNIAEKFALSYLDSIGIGIDFTARDLQQKAKEKGLPWELSKGFDGSAPISERFIPAQEIKDLKNIHFHLEVDQKKVQEGNTSLLLFPFEKIISYISSFITLRTGDYIFTGTPSGVGPVRIGQRLCAYIENEKMLDVEIK